MIYIIIAIIMFLMLITVHEWGHFISAKLVGVRVNEFAIGMGPTIFKKQKGETLYALRAVPIGGYCAMEGEDEDSDDPRAFGKQATWKQVIILIAGAGMNFVFAVVLAILLLGINEKDMLPIPVIDFLYPESMLAQNVNPLQSGDLFLEIDGNRIFTRDDVAFYFGQSYTGEDSSADVLIRRADGTKELYVGMRFDYKTYIDEDGEESVLLGVQLQQKDKTPLSMISHGFFAVVNDVRLVWRSLGDLVTGAVSLGELSGPIGIVDMMATTTSEAAEESISLGVQNILRFTTLISANLAVMNMLPLPALDGGRIFFAIVGGIYTKLSKRKMNSRIEAYIHAGGFVLLLGLMVFVAFHDVIRLVGG